MAWKQRTQCGCFGVWGFFFRFPLSCREVQLCRESIYLFHAGINSDVHLFLPKSELETNTVEGLFVCSQRSCNIKVLKSLEEISRGSDGGADSFIQLFRLNFILTFGKAKSSQGPSYCSLVLRALQPL